MSVYLRIYHLSFNLHLFIFVMVAVVVVVLVLVVLAGVVRADVIVRVREKQRYRKIILLTIEDINYQAIL